MGLDMFLYGKKFLWTNWEHPELNVTEDGFTLQEKTLQIGYWRKHPNLHGFIVQTFAKGVDECQEIELSDSDLEQILKAVKTPKKSLPTTGGFFFGSSNGSEKKEDIEILTKAIAWLKEEEDGVVRSIVYQASW